MWDKDNDYIVGQRKWDARKECSQAGVVLIQEFNGVLTIQGEQQQFLLQVIEEHRHDFPNPDKFTLTAKATKSKRNTHILDK